MEIDARVQKSTNNSIGKTTKTVRSKIEQIPENIIIKNDSSKPFRFKLDLKYLQQI